MMDFLPLFGLLSVSISFSEGFSQSSLTSLLAGMLPVWALLDIFISICGIFVFCGTVALYCTYCPYARTVLTYRIDLSYTYCTYIPYSFSPSRILNPDTVYVDASQLQATSFTFVANVVSFAFSSLLTYLVTDISSFSALQPFARPSPHWYSLLFTVYSNDLHRILICTSFLALCTVSNLNECTDETVLNRYLTYVHFFIQLFLQSTKVSMTNSQALWIVTALYYMPW